MDLLYNKRNGLFRMLVRIFLCTCLALILQACGNDEVKVIGQKEEAASSAQEVNNAFVFETRDTEGNELLIEADAPADELLQALGESVSYYEAPSCAFKGLDKMYTYPDFEIDTYPADDGDRVLMIYFLNDLAKTREGLAIGQSKTDMERIYGTPDGENDLESYYVREGTKLSVITENGRISAISYMSVTAGEDITEKR